MSVEVKAGDTYIVSGARNGDSWSLMKVKAEKGIGEIAIFTDRNMNLEDGQKLRVDKILSVKKSARKSGEKWFDTYTINAECAVCVGAPVDVKFTEANEPDPELPF